MDTHKLKISGYLEKKGKLRISPWKKYWFVLEGRLLLYYRSKDEYEAISPCKGSINMGPPCALKPYPAVINCFQINTRNTNYTLRAENADEQQKWMQAIMSSLNQNQNFTPENYTKLNHFRYSLDNLIPEDDPSDDNISKMERQYSMPHGKKTDNELVQRLQKMGAQTYATDTGAISKVKSKSPVLQKASSRISISSDGYAKIEERGSIYEKIHGDPDGRLKSFMVDNENYSVPVKKRHSWRGKLSGSFSNIIRSKSLIIENDQYGTARNEVIYTEPRTDLETDHNRNSVLIDNTLYASCSNPSDKSENLYEELDRFHNEYSEPIYAKSKSVSDGNLDKIPKTSKKTKSNKKKLSIIKSGFHSEYSEPIYDKNKSISDGNLDKIPKTPKKSKSKKKQSFIKSVLRKKSKKKDKTEEIYEEIPAATVDKLTLNDEGTVQMLSELQNVLVNQKNKLEKSISNQEDKLYKGDDDSSSSNSAVAPKLPPKTHNKHSDNSNNEQLRSIDEILQDLDKEKIQSKNKVQVLIEKFNEGDCEDVTLRQSLPFNNEINRYSDELTRLLNELVKVTTAPILTPGVTNSLITRDLTDDEWLQILPIRKRRLSDPDYDVPRSHKSLQLLPKSEAEDVLPPTRFFGPVLTTSEPEESACVSMTPDSLEVEDIERCAQNNQLSYSSHNYYDNDLRRDLYSQQLDNSKALYATPKSYFSVATHIVSTCQNICTGHLNEEQTVVYKNVRNIDVQEEVFRDSLESYHE